MVVEADVIGFMLKVGFVLPSSGPYYMKLLSTSGILTYVYFIQVFQRILKAYATKLYARLPKGGTGIVAAATGTDGQIKVITAIYLQE